MYYATYHTQLNNCARILLCWASHRTIASGCKALHNCNAISTRAAILQLKMTTNAPSNEQRTSWLWESFVECNIVRPFLNKNFVDLRRKEKNTNNFYWSTAQFNTSELKFFCFFKILEVNYTQNGGTRLLSSTKLMEKLGNIDFFSECWLQLDFKSKYDFLHMIWVKDNDVNRHACMDCHSLLLALESHRSGWHKKCFCPL